MAYTSSFIDGTLYGPEDVNEIVGDLVGAGVAPFISKDSYTPSDLNSLTAAAVSSGVQLGGCKVSRVSSAVVEVAPGIIYFGNGLRLKVTAAHSVTVPENTAVTIYAYYISSTGKGEISYSSADITKSDDKIPLALIASDGTITDIREFAEAKVATLGTNAVYAIPEEKVTIYENYEDAPDYNNYKIVAEIDLSNVNLNRFNYFFYYYYPDGYISGEDNTVDQRMWEFKKHKEILFYQSKESGVSAYNSDFYITREFNKFIFYTGTNSGSYWEKSAQVTCGQKYFRLV